MSPRSDRVLLEESPVWEPIASRRSVSDAGRLQNKKSARRLSDFVVNLGGEKAAKEPSVGSKRDVWRIRFNDVVILCQRIGFTNTPLGAEPRAKRGLPGPKRALYRFQRVETWEMQAGPALLGRRTPFVSTDDVHAEAGETDDEIGAEDSDLEANGGASRMRCARLRCEQPLTSQLHVRRRRPDRLARLSVRRPRQRNQLALVALFDPSAPGTGDRTLSRHTRRRRSDVELGRPQVRSERCRRSDARHRLAHPVFRRQSPTLGPPL